MPCHVSLWSVINDPMTASLAAWTSDQCPWRSMGRCHVLENGFSTCRVVRHTQRLFVNAVASVVVAVVDVMEKTSPAGDAGHVSVVYVSLSPSLSLSLCVCVYVLMRVWLTLFVILHLIDLTQLSCHASVIPSCQRQNTPW